MSQVVRVVTNCTKDKCVDTAAAKDLYRGLGHKFVKEGVQSLKGTYEVDWVIMSAKHGYVPANTNIAPYNFSFLGQSPQNMQKLQKLHTSSRNRLQSFLRRGPTPALQIVGMTKHYHSVFSLADQPPRYRTIVIGVQSVLRDISRNPQVIVVPARPAWASEGLGTNLVGLNGKITQLMLKGCLKYGADTHWANLKAATASTLLSYLKGIQNV